jgi:hypothetical protein
MKFKQRQGNQQREVPENQSMKLERSIVTLRKVEVISKESMEEEDLFLEEEEEP